MHRINFGEQEAQRLDTGWSLLPDPMDRAGRQQWWRRRRTPGGFQPTYDDDSFWPTTVPGAFNRVHPELAWYEGGVVYLCHFRANVPAEGRRAFLRFERVSDRGRVFLNGRMVGQHDGGQSPFTLDVTEELQNENRLLVLVDNKRESTGVPGEIHDWTHDGGIRGEVRLYELPDTFVRDVALRTTITSAGIDLTLSALVEAPRRDEPIPVEARLIDRRSQEHVVTWRTSAAVGAWSSATVRCDADALTLWSLQNPALYRLEVCAADHVWHDTVGLREVRTAGRQILLNSEPVTLRGVCTWTEDPDRGIFAMSEATARTTLDLMDELHANFARAGHCPPSEAFVRACDRAGVLLWVEVPAYWIPTMARPTESRRALQMFDQTLCALRNAPSVIIWSVGNECLNDDAAEGQSNLEYFIEATDFLHEHDPGRLVTYTGGVEGDGDNEVMSKVFPPEIVSKVDVVSFNSYAGGLEGLSPEHDDSFEQQYAKARYMSSYGKPVIHAEAGIDSALGETGFDFGEARGAAYHRKLQSYFREMVDAGVLQGLALFVLNDYSTPIKRSRFHRGYNRKGLLTNKLEPKKAFHEASAGYAKFAATQKLRCE